EGAAPVDVETRGGELRRAHRSAGARPGLQDQDVPAGVGEQVGRDQSVVPGADHDRVRGVRRHRRHPFPRRSWDSSTIGAATGSWRRSGVASAGGAGSGGGGVGGGGRGQRLSTGEAGPRGTSSGPTGPNGTAWRGSTPSSSHARAIRSRLPGMENRWYPWVT